MSTADTNEYSANLDEAKTKTNYNNNKKVLHVATGTDSMS